MKNSIIWFVVTAAVGLVIGWLYYTYPAPFVAKPEVAPNNLTIYTLSITYQNGDKEIKYTPFSDAQWIYQSDCVALNQKKELCGVRSFHYINPAQ